MPSASTPTADSSVLLVQISDSHLFADADGALLGLKTADSLARVVERVLAEQPHIDLVVASGDISQDGSLASYQRFEALTAPIKAPMRWFAGNHDEPLPMEQAAQGQDYLKPVIDLGNWRITLLNSAVPGSVPGYLADDQLQLLAQALSEAPDRHHLICLHHHPISIDCKWMEPIGLRNPHALFDVIDRFPQARAVLWGHIHQDFERERNDVRLIASPSTCIQFKPGSEDFALDDTAPGYRWLRLMPDGKIETEVSRLEGFVFTPDMGAEGY